VELAENGRRFVENTLSGKDAYGSEELNVTRTGARRAVDPALGIPKLALRSERRSVGLKAGYDIVADLVPCDPVHEADEELALLADGDRAVAVRQQPLDERVDVWARGSLTETTTESGRLDVCFEHGDLQVEARLCEAHLDRRACPLVDVSPLRSPHPNGFA
jgi:hypothetical protein